jgi:hypothetical protein
MLHNVTRVTCYMLHNTFQHIVWSAASRFAQQVRSLLCRQSCMCCACWFKHAELLPRIGRDDFNCAPFIHSGAAAHQGL